MKLCHLLRLAAPAAVAILATLALAGIAEAAGPWVLRSSTSTLQIAPSGSAGTTRTQGPADPQDVDICILAPAVFRDSTNDVGGHGSVYDCTEPTEVLSATIKLWEKGSDGKELELKSKSWNPGKRAPYTTPSIYAKCTRGLKVHTEFIGTLASDSGVGSFTRNTDPLTCK
jgi:hypothetical protein